ncbi:MAG: prephenate dehydrogenase/arogenate dehydrogenase family protein [Acidobacteriota bacterium]|nr:prephenate dehydrogenase/arogenate dehydrogenase family protein [Acidobacteriota bacterium]
MSSADDFFKRVAIIGAGLIGGSWGLALKKAGFRGVRAGCDRKDVLERALRAGAIDEGEEDLRRAVAGAGLVILAAPVGEILRILPELKKALPHSALVTDVGSTKTVICRAARENFGGNPLFLGGHPLAGKEKSGIAHASPEIFDGAAYILTPDPPGAMSDRRVAAFCALVKAIGGRPVQLDAEAHDKIMASLSHLPQLVSTALASLTEENHALPVDLAASGFRDVTRLASSPYGIWRDICLSNEQNIRIALDSLIAKLESVRDRLSDSELKREFVQAQRLRRRLEKLK